MIQAKSHLPRSEQCNSQHALNGDKTAGFVVWSPRDTTLRNGHRDI